MQAADYGDALRHLPIVPLTNLTGAGPIVVLSPHPDDETLGCGGLIAAAVDSGIGVTIVTITDGSASHPASESHRGPVLAALRRDETRRAAATLGVLSTELVHLDLPDAATSPSGPEFEATSDRIEAVVRQRGASALFVTSGLDPHCDHEAAAAMAQEVQRRNPRLKLWFYPIWSWHLPPESAVESAPPRGVRFDIAAFAAVKHAAIACHASQMTDLIADDPTGFRFTQETLAPFLRPYEVFLEAGL